MIVRFSQATDVAIGTAASMVISAATAGSRIQEIISTIFQPFIADFSDGDTTDREYTLLTGGSLTSQGTSLLREEMVEIEKEDRDFSEME